jgi:hypothetical protein
MERQDNYTQVIKVFEVLLAVSSVVIVLLYLKSYSSAQNSVESAASPYSLMETGYSETSVII